MGLPFPIGKSSDPDTKLETPFVLLTEDILHCEVIKKHTAGTEILLISFYFSEKLSLAQYKVSIPGSAVFFYFAISNFKILLLVGLFQVYPDRLLGKWDLDKYIDVTLM